LWHRNAGWALSPAGECPLGEEHICQGASLMLAVGSLGFWKDRQ
jgi:hypothetical protein